jgi:hypothetical protein
MASVAGASVLWVRACVLALLVAGLAVGLVVGTPGASASSCRVLPAKVTGPAPSALLSIIGVLRQPASAADELPANILADQTEFYVNSVRFARSAFGRDWYVWVAGPPAPLDASRCSAPVGVAFYGLGGRGGGGTSGATAAQIAGGGMWISIGGGTGADPARTLFAGVVPDGVATVTLHYAAGKLGGFSHRSGPALTVTGHAVNNVVVISVERAGEQARAAVTTTWRDADGTLLKQFHGEI